MPPAIGGGDSRRDELGADLTTLVADRAVRSAELAVQLASADPRRSERLSTSLLCDGTIGSEARAVALHAVALACLELGRLREARRRLQEGIELARLVALDRRSAELRATSALLWFHAERPARALGELDAALGETTSVEGRVALLGQRAHLSFRLGRYADGLATTLEAFACLEGLSGVETLEARVLSNRGIARCYQGDFEGATADCTRALELDRKAGAELLAAQVLHNLGFVAARMGDVPLAIRRFDQALVAYARLGIPPRALMVDRCNLLTTAGLLPEARRAASELARELEELGLAADAAEAHLTVAEAALAEHDPEAAIEQAAAAAAAFERQSRGDFVVLARDVIERARRLTVSDPLELYRSAAHSARALARAGWHEAALDATVSAAAAALSCGRRELALAVLKLGRRAAAEISVHGKPGLGGGAPPGPRDLGGDAAGAPDSLRVLAMHADALEQLVAGEVVESLATLRVAVELAKARARRLEAATARHGHGSPVAALARSGLSIALSHGGPAEVLEWADRCRLGLPASSRPASSRPGGGRSASSLELAPELPPPGELASLLGSTALVELVTHEGDLLAVVAAGGSIEVVRLGPVAAITRAQAALRFALDRLNLGRSPLRTRLAMAALLKRSADELDSAVLAPLFAGPLGRGRREPGEGPGAPELVLVPTGGLFDLPWGLLASIREWAIVLSPTATSWCEAARRGVEGQHGGSALLAGGEVLLVGAPGIEAAERELDTIRASCYEDRPVRVLAGPAATRAAVLEGLGRCEIAHVAAHGHFRADNPRMSSLELADGDLTVYEMESVRLRPRCVVLSSCDAGRIAAHPGEELAGAVPSLLACSGGTVVAGAAPLVDSAMPAVSAALHRRLSGGERPAAALCSVRRELGDPLERSDAELADKSALVERSVAAACLVCHAGAPGAPSVTAMRLGESSS